MTGKRRPDALESLLGHGVIMSNIAFNLSQGGAPAPDAHYKQVLRGACSNWDNALREYRALTKQSATRKPRARNK
jgi:hypothetical protein